MITDLEPYPAYRDPEVNWLGEVPEDWEVLPARSLFGEVVERNHPDEEMLSVTIRDGVIPQASLIEARQSKDGSNLNKSSYKLVRPGDLVYNKMRAWQGAAGLSSMRGIVSPAYIVMRSRGAIDPAYAHRLLRIPAFAIEAQRWSYGITSDQWSLRAKDFKQIYFPVPSAGSQAAIVRFLGHVDSLIRRLTTAKERLIELLSAEKRAIVHRVLTRGIDPSVSLRPSGVDWIGDVPAHWDVRPLKWAFRLQRGYDLPAEKRLAGSVPVVSSGGVVGTHAEVGAKGPGVVMGRYGSTGSVYFVDEDFWPHNTALFVTHFNRNEPRWVFYLLQVIPKAELAAKSAVPGIDRKDLHRILVPVPPIEEQRAMLDVLAQETETVVHATVVARRQIDLLREYRARLISDVVTGKLDVREAAANLPDDPDADDAALEEQLEEVAAG